VKTRLPYRIGNIEKFLLQPQRNAVTDSSVVEILSELKKIRTELVSADDLKNAKSKYIGNFVMQIQNQLL
jgi:hypothetical protein